MYKKLLMALTLAFCLPGSPAFAKYENLSGTFEKSLEHCLIEIETKDQSISCFNKLLAESFTFFDDEQAQPFANKLSKMLETWLDEDEFYAIHPLLSTKMGEVIERRAYFIESDKGNNILLDVVFMKKLNEWSLTTVHLTSKRDEVNQLLGLAL